METNPTKKPRQLLLDLYDDKPRRTRKLARDLNRRGVRINQASIFSFIAPTDREWSDFCRLNPEVAP